MLCCRIWTQEQNSFPFSRTDVYKRQRTLQALSQPVFRKVPSSFFITCDLCLFFSSDNYRNISYSLVTTDVYKRQVNDGEFVAVVGTSGSGKSTLLHMMGGLDTPTSGNVIVRDKELSKMNDEQLTIFRRRNIGFIFQNYNLVPILNVYENIVLPVELDVDTVCLLYTSRCV